MTWLDEVLSPIADQPAARFVVILDPQRLVEAAALDGLGDVAVVDDRWKLRVSWELADRGRNASADRRVVVVVDGTERIEELPFDISSGALCVPVVWPVRAELRGLFRELRHDEQGAELIQLSHSGASVREVLERLFGVSIPAGHPAGELAALAALRSRPGLPSSVWNLVLQQTTTPLACDLASEPPVLGPLRERWKAWLGGTASPADNAVFGEAGSALAALVTAGVLPSVDDVAPGLPAWTSLAHRKQDPVERAIRLLDDPPLDRPAASMEEWAAVATWWGAIRSALSLAPAAPDEVRERATATISEIDERFGPWIREHFGKLLLSASLNPATLDKVPDFLARRLDGAAGRVLLLVLDGMGFAQWHLIREAAGIGTTEQLACAAMIPTETSFSRQALLAGTPPNGFADSCETTQKEPQRWGAFWAARGLRPDEIGYHRIDGVLEDRVALDRSQQAVVVVVSAVDKMIHGASLMHDAQLASGIRVWIASGALQHLIAQADELGFEIWVTSDHGNLVAQPAAAPREGVKLERAGTRVRIFKTETLRHEAEAYGLAWDPPRFPATILPLFAPGRTGFHSGSARVTHGGMSLEEVLVPLARLET